MVDVNARFRWDADFSPIQAQVRSLARDITMLNASFVAMDKTALRTRKDLADSFASNINASGQFKASFVDLTSATEQFGRAIEKRTLSLREYFREARRVYQQDSMGARLAERQVRMRQSQVIGLGATGPGGRRQAMVVTPLQLDTSDFNTKMQVAAEKYAVFNRLVDDGATKLINWGKNTQWAGRQLTVGLTMPLVLFGAAVSKSFRDVDKELTRFAKVYGSDLVGANSAATQKMKEQIQSLAIEYSKAYGIAAKETAALAADLAATGLEGNKLVGAVAQTTRLAVLGEVDRQEAMQTTLALQSAFQQSTKELADSINFLNAVENQTSASLQDFTLAIPKAGPVVRQLGGDIKDLAVMLTAMREGGIPAAEAANAIKSGLASMINPTKAASERLAKLGVDINGIVERNRGDLMPTLMEFSGVINQLDSFARAKVIEELFGKYQFARISALFDNLNRQGSQTAQVLELMGASSADLAKVANQEINTLTESVSMRFTRAIEGFKAALLPIGEVLTSSIIPFIEGASKALGKMIEFFNALPDPVKNVGKLLLGLTAAAGPLIMLTGVFGNFLGYITKGVLKMNNFIRMLMGLPVSKLEILDEQTIAASRATDLLTESFNREASSLSLLNTQLEAYAANLRQAAAVSPSLFTPGSPARPGKGRPPVRRSSGGDIPGYGGGDRVPALLEPGEFVVKKEVANKNRGFLRALNSGTIQRFSDGGDVNSSTRTSSNRTEKHFAHSIRPDGNNYLMVGFNIDSSMNLALNNPSGTVNPREYIAQIMQPDSIDRMQREFVRAGVPDSIAREYAIGYRDAMVSSINNWATNNPDRLINDKIIYSLTDELMNTDSRGSEVLKRAQNAVNIGSRIVADIPVPQKSLAGLKSEGVDVDNARSYLRPQDFERETGISLGLRPGYGITEQRPGAGWAIKHIPASGGRPEYVVMREWNPQERRWSNAYNIYIPQNNEIGDPLFRSKGGGRSNYSSTIEPRVPSVRTPVVRTVRPTTPPSVSSRPSGSLGPRGRIAAGFHPTTRFGPRPIVRAMPGEVYLPPTAYADNGAMINSDGSVSPLQQRRGMMGSSLMNIGFAGSMLAGLTTMNGEVTAATSALSAFTTALMVAGTALEMSQMMRGRGAGAGLMGMSGLGKGMMAKGGAMKAAGAAKGGITGLLKSGAGMGLLGAGRMLVTAGGPWGMAIAAAIAVAIGAVVQFNRILQNMKDSAKAAFAEPTQSAEYFGIELGRSAERAQEFSDIVESLGMTASKTADQIDEELVKRVGSDYESLISRIKGSKDTQAVGTDLKLAYSSMIAQGFGKDEATAIVEEIARQANQQPIYLQIKGQLEMLGDDPAKIAQSIAQNSAQALKFANEYVQKNMEEERANAIKSFVQDSFTGYTIPAVVDLFKGEQNQFLDFAGAWDTFTQGIQRAIDPTKRFSTEMQSALSTMTNAGELFGGSMNTLFEQFKQFPQETQPAIDTVLGYVNNLDDAQREAFDSAVAKNFTENVADPALLAFYENLGVSNDDLALKMKMAEAASLGLANGLSALYSQGKLTQQAIDELVQKVILLDNLNVQMDESIQNGIDAMKKQSREASQAYDSQIKDQEKLIKNLQKSADKEQENHDAYMKSLEDESRALDERARKIQENADKQQELIDKKIKTLQVSQEQATFDQQQRERAFGVLGALMSGDAMGYEQARIDYVQAQQDRQRELAIQGLQDRKDAIAKEAQDKLDAIDKEQRAIDDRARAAQDAHDAYMQQNADAQDAAQKRIDKIEVEKNKTLKAIQAQINLLEEYKAQGYLTQQQVNDLNAKLKTMGAKLPSGIRTTLQDISTGIFGPNGDYTKIVNGLIGEMAKALNVSEADVRSMLGSTLTGQYGTPGSTPGLPAGTPHGSVTGTGSSTPIPGNKKGTPGGKIQGIGTPTSDSIIARLSRGEYVVKASSVNKIGTSTLDYINATGRIPGYAQGSPGGVGSDQQSGGFWGTGPNAMTVLSIRALQDLYGRAVSTINNTTSTTTTNSTATGFDQAALSALGVTMQKAQQLMGWIQQAGWPKHLQKIAWVIAMRESSGIPEIGPGHPSFNGEDFGLFQINKPSYGGQSWWSDTAMIDPIQNAKAAYLYASNNGTNFLPWAMRVNPDGSYTWDWSYYGGTAYDDPNLRAAVESNTQQYWNAISSVTTSSTPTTGSPSSAGQAAVTYATSQQGKPYSMNATPPSSWDCSKLTAWAWAVATGADPNRGYNDPNAKVRLTPYSHVQATQISKRVIGDGGPISGLLPGDILYFNGIGSQSGGHTSIYAGNNQVFEASSPSIGLRYADLNNSWNQQYFAWGGAPPGYAKGGLIGDKNVPIGDKPRGKIKKYANGGLIGLRYGGDGGGGTSTRYTTADRAEYNASRRPTYFGGTPTSSTGYNKPGPSYSGGTPTYSGGYTSTNTQATKNSGYKSKIWKQPKIKTGGGIIGDMIFEGLRSDFADFVTQFTPDNLDNLIGMNLSGNRSYGQTSQIDRAIGSAMFAANFIPGFGMIPLGAKTAAKTIPLLSRTFIKLMQPKNIVHAAGNFDHNAAAAEFFGEGFSSTPASYLPNPPGVIHVPQTRRVINVPSLPGQKGPVDFSKGYAFWKEETPSTTNYYVSGSDQIGSPGAIAKVTKPQTSYTYHGPDYVLPAGRRPTGIQNGIDQITEGGITRIVAGEGYHGQLGLFDITHTSPQLTYLATNPQYSAHVLPLLSNAALSTKARYGETLFSDTSLSSHSSKIVDRFMGSDLVRTPEYRQYNGMSAEDFRDFIVTDPDTALAMGNRVSQIPENNINFASAMGRQYLRMTRPEKPIEYTLPITGETLQFKNKAELMDFLHMLNNRFLPYATGGIVGFKDGTNNPTWYSADRAEQAATGTRGKPKPQYSGGTPTYYGSTTGYKNKKGGKRWKTMQSIISSIGENSQTARANLLTSFGGRMPTIYEWSKLTRSQKDAYLMSQPLSANSPLAPNPYTKYLSSYLQPKNNKIFTGKRFGINNNSYYQTSLPWGLRWVQDLINMSDSNWYPGRTYDSNMTRDQLPWWLTWAGDIKNLSDPNWYPDRSYSNGGHSKDDIIAKVSSGEYVMSAPAVAAIGKKNMDLINQGKLPGYSTGGLVGDPKFTIPSNTKINKIENSSNKMIKSGDIIYNINVDVAETNASPDDIANRVMRQIKTNQNARRLRSNG